MLVFEEGGKPENLEKNPWSKGEKQQQTQPTNVSRVPGVICGLSLLLVLALALRVFL